MEDAGKLVEWRATATGEMLIPTMSTLAELAQPTAEAGRGETFNWRTGTYTKDSGDGRTWGTSTQDTTANAPRSRSRSPTAAEPEPECTPTETPDSLDGPEYPGNDTTTEGVWMSNVEIATNGTTDEQAMLPEPGSRAGITLMQQMFSSYLGGRTSADQETSVERKCAAMMHAEMDGVTATLRNLHSSVQVPAQTQETRHCNPRGEYAHKGPWDVVMACALTKRDMETACTCATVVHKPVG